MEWALITFIVHAPLTVWIWMLATGPTGSQTWSWLLPAALILLAGWVLYVGWRYIRYELNRSS